MTSVQRGSAGDPGAPHPPSAHVRTRFPDLPAGAAHYESVYLKACAPGGGRAIWLRHTVLKRPGALVTGAVWLTCFDVAWPRPRALRVGGAPETPADDWMTVAGCRIDAEGARGTIASGSSEARWAIGWTPTAGPADHLPAERLYEAPLPRTKSRSPIPAATLEGSLCFGDLDLDLTGWTGMVGHNWGSEHAEQWIWLHAAGDEGWLDVALGRVRIGGLLLPWFATGHVALDGRPQRVQPGMRPVRRAAPDGARLQLRAGVRAVDLEVTVPADAAIAWRYGSPDGEERLTVNCSVSDLVLRRGEREVRFPAAAAYELGGAPDAGIPLGAPEPG